MENKWQKSNIDDNIYSSRLPEYYRSKDATEKQTMETKNSWAEVSGKQSAESDKWHTQNSKRNAFGRFYLHNEYHLLSRHRLKTPATMNTLEYLRFAARIESIYHIDFCFSLFVSLIFIARNRTKWKQKQKRRKPATELISCIIIREVPRLSRSSHVRTTGTSGAQTYINASSEHITIPVVCRHETFYCRD